MNREQEAALRRIAETQAHLRTQQELDESFGSCVLILLALGLVVLGACLVMGWV